jgi:hypothetical protein
MALEKKLVLEKGLPSLPTLLKVRWSRKLRTSTDVVGYILQSQGIKEELHPVHSPNAKAGNPDHFSPV